MKIHLRRAYAGSYFPACYANSLRPDPAKALLPTTEIKENVTCKRCQRLIASGRHFLYYANLKEE